MKNILIPICAFTFLVFSACGPDAFESTVEIEIPDHTPTIVLSGVIEEGAELFETTVTHSQSKNSPNRIENLVDAKVQLFKDGNLLADLAYDNNSERFFANLAPTDLTAGSTYRIEAEHPSYESVFAEQTIPNPVSIDKFEYDSSGTVDQFGEPADQFKITLTDRAGEDNYYAINAFQVDTFIDNFDTAIYVQTIELMSLDPSIVFGYHPDNYAGVPMISDAAFPGKKYDLVFNAYELNLQEGEEFIIELKSITRERYLFLLSLKGYYDSDGNPFAEPVTVLSNVENGNGAFGAESVFKVIYTKR